MRARDRELLRDLSVDLLVVQVSVRHFVLMIGSIGIATWLLLLDQVPAAAAIGFAIGALMLALLRQIWREHQIGQRSTLLLLGSDPELSIISAFLAGHRGAPASAIDTRHITTVIEAPTVEDAAIRLAQIRCDEIVVGSTASLGDSSLLRDRRGHAPRLVPAREKLAHLFGRVRMDLVANDPWFAAPEHGRRTLYPPAKRGIDVLVSLLCIALFLLPGALIAAVLWIVGYRPPIMALPRVGLNHRVFNLYRFRTGLNQGHDNPALSPIAIRTGLIVGRMHLDQLPSLWNVLRGDLSLIGPRPEPSGNVERMNALVPAAAARLWVRPGLASLAQVRFRYSESLRDTVLALEYDLYYVKHRSWSRDLRVFLRACWLLVCDVGQTAAVALRAVIRMTGRSATALRAQLPMRPAALASVALPRHDDGLGETHRAALIVGAGSGGRQLVQELRRDHLLHLWPVAFVDDDPAKIGTRIVGLPVLGDTDMIMAIARREHIDTVIIAIPSAPELVVKRIADEARKTDAQVLTMPDIGTVLRGGTSLPLQTVPMTDVLGRPMVEPDHDRCRLFLSGKRVLITGAAGSIGSELARQVAQSAPTALFGLDINESDLYDLMHEVSNIAGAAPLQPIVASVTDHARIARLLRDIRPDIVFHAAAYKHVPLMEDYPAEAVETNTIATYHLARAAVDAGVQRFVLVSTDKAVRPSSVMGGTKRLAELSLRAVCQQTGLSGCSVRFGNVLGSRGSVIPLFEKQISHGGPVTVTHPDMMRYFMTIPEAVGLIIEAGALGDDNVIYILDMGEEVPIRALAERLIRLKGLRVGADIPIVYTGMRPGEKLRESLSLELERANPTEHPKIRRYTNGEGAVDALASMDTTIAQLGWVARSNCPSDIRARVLGAVAAIDGGVYQAPGQDDPIAAEDAGPSLMSVPTNERSLGAADD